MISGLMDQPTHQKVGALVGYSNSYVKLSAIFSETILDISEDKKFQAEVELGYNHEGKPRTIKKSVPVTIHGRNAISWADKRRLAAFISPNVTEIIDYNRKADQIFSNSNTLGLNKTILKALQLYTLLQHDKVIYSPDPEQSFALVTTNTEILDFLQYPTETLVRKSGDCDDLVAVFCSLLENAGIATAYVDVPGHVFMAFDAQIPPNKISGSGLEETEVVILYDKVWIPVETTLIGTHPFLTSWKNAANRYYKELAAGNFPEIVPLSDARKVYLPSNYTPGGFKAGPTLAAGALELYSQQVSELFTKTRKEVLNELEARYKTEPLNVFVKNKYALLLIQIADTAKAENVLLEAFELSPSNASVLNNLGNIYYFRDEFDKAIQFYSQAAKFDSEDGEIFINLTKAWMNKGDNNQAKLWFQQALKVDPEMASLYDYLIKELQ